MVSILLPPISFLNDRNGLSLTLFNPQPRSNTHPYSDICISFHFVCSPSPLSPTNHYASLSESLRLRAFHFPLTPCSLAAHSDCLGVLYSSFVYGFPIVGRKSQFSLKYHLTLHGHCDPKRFSLSYIRFQEGPTPKRTAANRGRNTVSSAPSAQIAKRSPKECKG